MSKVMLDLETLGNSSNSAIIAIGAVKFNENGIVDRFYKVVDLHSSISNGLKVDASTILWWMQQSDEARGQFKSKGDCLIDCLKMFAEWANFNDDSELWGNGSAFDNVILSNAYRACNINVPWPFWGDRCYRTMKSLFDHVQFERLGTHHNAVNDAESQALHLIEIMKSIK